MNRQELFDQIIEGIANAQANDLDAMITLRGALSKRIGELENAPEITHEAEGTVGETSAE